MSIKRKYIDSHWLVFVIHGVIAFIFGLYITAAAIQASLNTTTILDPNTLVIIIGIAMLAMGIIELLNMLYRSHRQETWGLTLVIGLLEVATAFALLFTLEQNIVLHLVIISIYTIARGVLEIMLGLKSIDDLTDKFIWTVCGVCGVVLGFIILNAGTVDPSKEYTFIEFFGAYFMIFGIGNLIYGVHNLNQKHDYAAERRELARKTKAVAAKSSSKTAKTTTHSVKSAKSTKVAKKPSVRKTSKTTKKTTARRK